jgi:hypothetical protein
MTTKTGNIFGSRSEKARGVQFLEGERASGPRLHHGCFRAAPPKNGRTLPFVSRKRIIHQSYTSAPGINQVFVDRFLRWF